MSRESRYICLCGPSASGKSTICRALLNSELPLTLSVSTTTREPRAGETDGVDYYFVSREEFERRLANDAFVEHAEYGGQLYGTERSNFTRATENQVDLLLDIDVQGVSQLRRKFGESVHVVFVAPPSMKILEQRFRDRPGSTEEKLRQRLAIAQGELEILNTPGFSNFKVVNDQLETAVTAVLEHLSALNT